MWNRFGRVVKFQWKDMHAHVLVCPTLGRQPPPLPDREGASHCTAVSGLRVGGRRPQGLCCMCYSCFSVQPRTEAPCRQRQSRGLRRPRSWVGRSSRSSFSFRLKLPSRLWLGYQRRCSRCPEAGVLCLRPRKCRQHLALSLPYLILRRRSGTAPRH